jgi:hypothetical protein
MRLTTGELAELRAHFRWAVRVEEKFGPDKYNIAIPEDKVDDVLEWCEDKHIEATLV